MNDQKIEIIANQKDEAKKSPAKKSPAKIARKKIAKKSPAKKLPAKKMGVILSIIDILLRNQKKGISKNQILDRLAKKFPERNIDGMRATIGVQCPSRINNERQGLNIIKKDDKYFISDKRSK